MYNVQKEEAEKRKLSEPEGEYNERRPFVKENQSKFCENNAAHTECDI
jgi:hypothetical protein